jgi:hypothetical protein
MAEKKGYDTQKLIDKLAPAEIHKHVEDKHRKAHHEARSDKYKVDTHPEFAEELKTFVKKYKKSRDGHEPDDHRAYGEAKRLLNALFEREGGYKGAFDLASEGKLNVVLQKLSDHYEASERNDYINHAMIDIDPRDSDSHKDIAKKVVELYKGFLPKGVETDPDILAADYEGLLQGVHEMSKQAVKMFEKKKPAKKALKEAA